MRERERDIRLSGRDCTSSVARCNSLRVSSVMERVPRTKQPLCAHTKDIYLVGASPSLISPETK